MHQDRRSVRIALALVIGLACRGERAPVRGESGGEAAVASRATAPADEALVRIVNAIPGEGPVDVYAGDARAFANVAFRAVTAYARVTPNTPTFRFALSGQPLDRPLAEEMALTRDARAYTLVAMGGADSGTVDIEVLRDDADPGDSTKALFRVVNAAAGSGELDVFLGADEAPFFDDLDVRDDDGYREAEPGVTTLVVRPDDQRTVVLRLPNLSLKAGHRFTLVLTRAAPGSPRLSAIRVDDAGRAEPTAGRDSAR